MEWYWDWSDGDTQRCWAELYELWADLDIISLLNKGGSKGDRKLKGAQMSEPSLRNQVQNELMPWQGTREVWG